MKKMKRLFCLMLSMAMLAGMVPAVVGTVSAEGTAYQLAALLTEGKIKPLGRTAVNPDSTGIMCDWPGNGFQMNVTGDGGTLEIVVSTNYAANWVVLCDDTQVYWERLAATGGTISATIPAGDHLISVIKESDNQGKETDYCDLTTMTYSGTIGARPADKDLVIEFVGDSYSAGWGTLGTYKPGRSWPGTEHSFIHAYSYLTAKALDADYMIAARGGIGLFDGVSAEQPDDDPDATILDIYPYTAGFRKSAGLYNFDRQADIIILELGANDSIKESDANFTAAKWKEAMEEMVDMAREGNPDAAIVLLSHKAAMFSIDRQIVEERKETDPNLYYFSYAHQGNGSGGSTQYYGHPNIEDNEHWADALVAFLEERGLVNQKTAPAAPTYTDFTYYVSANGNDSNDGTTLATAKLTLKAALEQAKTDRSYTDGQRIVVNAEGTVNINASSSQALAKVDGLTLPDGSDVPILVQTNNYSGTKAILNTNHDPADKNSCMVYFGNSMTLKDITFQATTGASGFRDYQLYAGYNHIVFDNVTFAHAGGTTTTSSAWYVNTTHILSTEEGTQSAITFRNGDYTNITATAVYRANMVSPTVTNAPTVHTKVIIEDGAIMKNLYNRWGELGLGSSTVEIRGGTVETYFGTVNSTSASYSNYLGDINFVMTDGTVNKFVGTSAGTETVRKTVEGDVNFTMEGGCIGGTGFAIVGNYADVTGNVNFTMHGGDIKSNEFNTVNRYCTVSGAVTNTVSGGIIEIRPTADYNTVNFGARLNGTLGSVTNNFSGGQFLIVVDTAVITGYYLGGVSNCTVNGRVTNNITGGSFVPMIGEATPSYSALNFGILSGAIKGGLYNNLIGGSYDMGATANGGFVFGAYSNATPIAKIVNVFGSKDGWQGPVFKNGTLNLAGSGGAIGVTTKPTAMPAASDCSDEVVISSTFYNGYFSSTNYAGPSTADSSTAFNFVKGSIETNIYGGQLQSTFYGAGQADVYGKVTVNLYGGHVGNIYTAGNTATVYDGAELNIHEGFEEYHDVYKTNSWHFWGGSYKANIPAPQTAGRDAIKITVNAETPANLTLKTPIMARCANSKTVSGSVNVQVNGGTFPEGFTVDGVTVEAALGTGCMAFDTTTGLAVELAEGATTTGTTSVTVTKPLAQVTNGETTLTVGTVKGITSNIQSTGTTQIKLLKDYTQTSTIVLPYSCTLDFNGHTITTNLTSGNGMQVSAIGTENAITTLKNGTLLSFEIAFRVNAGAIVADNMTIRTKSGAPIGLYDTSGNYKDINRVTGSTLSSGLYGAIVFNKKNADFSATGISVDNSVLIAEKAGGASVLNKQSGTTAGTVTLGENVELYSFGNTMSSCPTDGAALTKTTGKSVTVCGTTFTGMNKWSNVSYVVSCPDNGTEYKSLTEAMAALEETGGTLQLQQDVTESVVTVRSGITLDLNGHTVDSKYFTCYGSVTETGDGGTALVKAARLHIAGQDSYLPIYDSQDGGYRFYKYTLENLGAKAVDGNSNAVKFGFRLVLNNADGYDVLTATTDEALDTFAYISWGSMSAPIVYQFRDDTLRSYAAQAMADISASGSTNKAITITLTGTDILDAGTAVTVYDAVESAPGVTAESASATWTKE